MNLLKLFYFSADFKVEINVPSHEVIKKLAQFLSTDQNTIGDVSENEFAFMNVSFPQIKPMSIAIFSGLVQGHNDFSTLIIKARLNMPKPLFYFYLIGMLSLPITYFFNIGGSNESWSGAPILMNPLFLPVWFYFFSLFAFAMKVFDGRNVMIGFKIRLEKSNQ